MGCQEGRVGRGSLVSASLQDFAVSVPRSLVADFARSAAPSSRERRPLMSLRAQGLRGRHAEIAIDRSGKVHELPAVRDGLLVRARRQLQSGQVAHQGLRVRARPLRHSLHLHPMRGSLVHACLPGRGDHQERNDRRHGGQRADLRRLQGLHHRLPLRHGELQRRQRQGHQVRPLRRRSPVRRGETPLWDGRRKFSAST